MRRTRLALLAPALSLCLAAGATPAFAQEKLEITPALVAAAEKEGEFTLLYSSPLASMQGMTDDFRKAYPKIKVNLERKAGSSGANALSQEVAAGVNRVDVFQGSDMAASQSLVDQKVFAAIAPVTIGDYLPAASIQAPWLYYPDLNSSVVAYNPKFVTDAEAQKLRSWTGILDPAFKGRISLVEPVFGVTLAPLLYVMNTPGLGEDFLKKLKAQDPHVYLNTAQAREALVSGQKPISWGAQWEAVMLADIEKGTPVRFVYPEPRVEWGGTSYGVLAKAPHPNAARLFLAWKFSKAGVASEQSPHTSNRPSLKQFDDARSAMKAVQKEAWFRMPPQVWNPDPADWVKNGTAYQETWMAIMKGGKR
jgi:iron(III) transport system substrate-binding protein